MANLRLEDSTAILRDEFVSFKEANVSVASSPFLYGLCVYSVFSANWNEEKQQLYVFRLKDHYERLVKSCRLMGFSSYESLHDFETFQSLMLELIRRNEVKEDALIRAMVFIDELSAGTRITDLKIAFTAYVYPMGEILKKDGIRAGVSSWTRNADNMIPSRAKLNGSYINASLMKSEALLNGFDEAIALDTSGHVAEGTVANIFLVRDGALVTPGVHTDILEGITRDSLSKLASVLDISLEERSIDRSELYIADEAMMVGSSAQVVPILEIDHRMIGDGVIGPVTKRIADAYNDIQRGNSEHYHEWLLPVYQ